MKVKEFNLTINDEAGEAGRRWLTRAFERNAKKLDELDDILDATSETKRQALKSGLFSSVDGSLKWEVPKEPLTENKWLSFVNRRFPGRLANLQRKIQEKYKCKSKRITSVEDLLPSHLEKVNVNLIAEKAKRKCSFQAAFDSSNGSGVELSGFQPFLFDSNWIAEGAVKLSPFRWRNPDLEVKVSRPLVVTKNGEAQLETLNICAKRKREAKRHLAHLIDSTTSEAACLFNDKNETGTGCASIGIRHLDERQKSASIRAHSLTPTFNRWSLFGTSLRNHKLGGGGITSKLHVDVPMSREISRGVLEVSSYWLGRKSVGDYLRLTTRAGLATIWSRRGLEDVPLSRRLYLGGTANELPLRSFTANEVGGLISPPQTAFGSASQAEHLGGAYRLNGSVELAVVDPLRKVTFSQKISPLVIQTARDIVPFAFADYGMLLPQIPYNPFPLKTARIAAGIGLSCRVGPMGRVNLTAGKAIKDDFAEAADSCFNISFISSTD